MFQVLASFLRFFYLDQQIGKIHAAHGIVRMACNGFFVNLLRFCVFSGCKQEIAETVQRSHVTGLKL